MKKVILGMFMLSMSTLAFADESCIITKKVGPVLLRGSAMTKFTADVECSGDSVTLKKGPGIPIGMSLSLINAKSDANGVCRAFGFKGGDNIIAASLRGSDFGGAWTILEFVADGSLFEGKRINANQDAQIIESINCLL